VSYLDRIKECNAFDPAHFVPFTVDGVRVGLVKHPFARRLKDFPRAFTVSDGGVAMAPGLDTYGARTSATDEVLRRLAEAGDISGWRDEPYPVGGPFAGPHLMTMERAAVPLFGVRAYGIHINGFVRDDDGSIRMWIARRAATKQTYPGMLDNMIAGGQPVGIGLRENVIKEAAEEAAVPYDLASRAVPVGIVTYRQETEAGFKPDVMYAYDLELTRDFQPKNTDGEISEFYLWPAARVMETVAETREFKSNCNLIIIDFLIRHGLIGPDRPDYIEIVRGLRR
jgi:isopentenyldiphosphate isomerase